MISGSKAKNFSTITGSEKMCDMTAIAKMRMIKSCRRRAGSLIPVAILMRFRSWN